MTDSSTCPRCGGALAPHAAHGICPRCLLEAGIESRPISPAGGTDQPTDVSGSPAAPLPQEVAALFPHLEILELLGRGGMGAVYKARQRDLHRVVALKILAPELARDPAFGERFVREGRALASLNHPQIVTIHDFGQAHGVYYLLMEYVDGVNLRQAQQAGTIAPEQVLSIISQICEALEYAHEEGVIHRDIKPENILLDRRGRVKIADFGLAKLVRNEPADLPLTQTRQVMGTLHYMAPEQIEHPTKVDHRADIYSLGVVFYELLTGELPLGRFQTPSHKVQIDVRLDEIVLRALEREPQRRYQRAVEVKTELDTVTQMPAAASGLNAANPTSVDAVASRVRFPAIGLCVVGALNCAISVLALLALVCMFVSFHRPGLPAGMGVSPLELLLACGFVPIGVLLVVGSLQMLRLNSYSWAVAAAVLALIPCTPFFFISLPLGIWALFVLSQGETRAAFERRRTQQLAQPPRDNGQINWAGTGLLVSGASQLLCGVLSALVIPYVIPRNAVIDIAGMGIFSVFGGLCFVCSVLMIVGGKQMLGRGSWELARAGAITALIPLGPWWLVCFPCGLCALVVLYKPGVRNLFGTSDPEREDSAASGAQSNLSAGAKAGYGPSPAKLVIPAVGLVGAATVQVLFAIYLIAVALEHKVLEFASVRTVGLVGFPVVSLLFCLLMVLGALQMLSPGSIGLARAGAIAGLLPFGPGWIIGFPSGIWALVVLNRAGIRTLFLSNTLPQEQSPRSELKSWEGMGGEPPGAASRDPEDWPTNAPHPSPQAAAKLKLMGVIGVIAIVAAIALSIRPMWTYALFDAARRGDAARIRTLLTFSQDVNVHDKAGMTPLMHAAREGHVMAIRALTPFAAVDEPDNRGITPLMEAALSGEVNAVHALLDANARINQPSRAGDTALMFAAQNGGWVLIVAMLQRGADPSIQNHRGETALMLAASYGRVEAVDTLLRRELWAIPGRTYGPKSLDAIVNLRDQQGETALFKGVSQNAEIVRKLLEAHADPKLGRPDQTTPLFEAAHVGHVRTIELLLQAGADPNHKRTDGETALSMAVAEGRDEVIDALLKGSATPVPSLDVRHVYQLALTGNSPEARPLIEKALQELPAGRSVSRFGLDGWKYEVPDTRRLLNLLLADCLARGGEQQRFDELLQQVLAGWPQGSNPVEIYERRGSIAGSKIRETYSLRSPEVGNWRIGGGFPMVQLSRLSTEDNPGRETPGIEQSQLDSLIH